jgi:hypothetical protein
LTVETVAIEKVGVRRFAIHVPAGSIITVRSGTRPNDSRMLDIHWAGHELVMFADDIEKRGEEVGDASG